MSIVFIVQEPQKRAGKPPVNIMGAAKFGEFRYIMSANERQITAHNSEVFVEHFYKEMFGFSDIDFLLLIGDPAAIGIACAVAANLNKGRFNMLKWDRHEKFYYSISVDINMDVPVNHSDDYPDD